MTNGKYDLLARTIRFAEAIVEFARRLPENSLIYPLKPDHQNPNIYHFDIGNSGLWPYL